MTEVSTRGGGAEAKALKSVKDLPVRQDGPPPGGFPAVRYGRRIPNTGPSGVALLVAGTAAVVFGFYRVGQGNLQRRELKREKMDARRAILPLLQAEEDARFVREYDAVVEEERKVMRNVPGWKPGESVYYSGRWMPPASGRLTVEF